MNGKPVANQPVRVGVEGGGDQPNSNSFGSITLGHVGAQEVVTGTTDANGQLQVTFTPGTHPGTAALRAELLHTNIDTGKTIVLGTARIEITLDAPRKLSLPFIHR